MSIASRNALQEALWLYNAGWYEDAFILLHKVAHSVETTRKGHSTYVKETCEKVKTPEKEAKNDSY